ncbi:MULTISPECIES: hypothetical protein [Oceanobacillus]|uniref:Uncharacterized protein n=1 Tax=Oceanobacillus kimchii TaxID=746691 RepID=A0ABQ5TPI7_9BACI|nr:hypothetical protein [Oceanobacillus kimchii]GLO68311.1 hypothetical protein MACH08_40950 [Oceanobacillus kimchii]
MFDIADNLLDILGDVFSWFYSVLVEPFLILHSFHNLIFGEGQTEDLVYKTFNTNEIENIFGPGATIVATIAGFFILAAIVMAGMRISSTVINPASRTYYIEFLKDLIIVVIVFFNLGFFYEMVFTLNEGIVNVFAANSGGGILGIADQITGGGIIGAIVINIIILFLTLWANWYYMMRKLTLLILMILGPLMIAFFLIPQLKPITGAWLKEFVGTVFVQSIHAVLLWAVLLITAGSDPITSGEFKVTDPILNLEVVILYLIFIPVGESIRALLGMGGGMNSTMSKVGAMFGMSALAGVYGSVKGAMDKNNNSSVMGALKGAKDGVKSSNNGSSKEGEESIIKDATMAANTGTDSSSTPKADAMLKWGDIGSRAGKAVLGSAGSIGGAAIGGPMGSMVGATGGFIAGGVAGGLAGRGTKALGDLAGKGIKNGKSAFQETWGEMSDPLSTNQEDVANTLANKDTADYELANKDSFIEKAREKFPDLDKQGLEQQWEDHKSDVHAGNLSNARNLVKRSTSKDGKLANTDSLANQSAEAMTNKWANDNKDNFEQNYDLENPLSENATEQEKTAHSMAKENSWNQAVASKRSEFQGVANDTANQMKANAMGSEHVDRGEFAKNFADNMQNKDNQSFVDEYKRQNPNATLDEANEAFHMAKRNQAKENFANSYLATNNGATREQANEAFESIQSASSKDAYVNSAMNAAQSNHKAVAENAYDSAKSYIDGNNKEGFIENYQSNINPSATKEQASQMYESIKGSTSKQAFMKDQSFTPSDNMIKQTGDTYDMAQQHAISGNKSSFVDAYQTQNPNATKEQAELLYDKANGMVAGGARSYMSSANNSINGVAPEAVFNKGANQQVNRGYLTNQLASAKTLDDKQNFIQDKMASGMEEPEATQMWSEQEPQKFQDNLSHFNNQLPQSMPMKQMIRKSDGMQKMTAGAAATGAFISNSTGIKPAWDKAGDVVNKGKMVSQTFMNGYEDGSSSILESPESMNNTGSKFVTQTKAIGSGLSQGLQNVTSSFQPSSENAVEKQERFRNAVAYTGGLVGGAKLYQKAGQFASKVSPYNKAINQGTESGVYEASEIQQMASQKNPETGQYYVPEGNIKLVSTPTQSYVQATDSSGRNRIVSRYGSGDSALKEGQVIYQDLNMSDNGGFVASSNPYQMDTGGSKVNTGRNINVNPNKLIATQRPNSINKRVTQDISPYNASVETGSFSKKEAAQTTDNIRMIVTKDRSYMVGNDKSTGQEVRISPYKQGDARLNANDMREVKYEVRNTRFHMDNITDGNGQKVNYTPRLETEEYLNTPTNQRYQRRKQFDKERFKKIGGAE